MKDKDLIKLLKWFLKKRVRITQRGNWFYYAYPEKSYKQILKEYKTKNNMKK